MTSNETGPTVDPLDSAYAKLNRAKAYVEALRASVIAASPNGEPENFTLRSYYDASAQAVITVVDVVPEDPGDWGLLLGDALHNLRCALDHLAWQLAIRKYGGEPTDRKIIRNVQFPIVTDQSEWPTHRHRKHMLDSDADILWKFQPFHQVGQGPNVMSAVWALAVLSNQDKHQMTHPAYAVGHQGNFRNTGRYEDCVPRREIMPDGTPADVAITGLSTLRPGDEVVRVFVTPTGPSPEVDLESRVTGYVAVNETWNLMETLDACAHAVSDILQAFTPFPALPDDLVA